MRREAEGGRWKKKDMIGDRRPKTEATKRLLPTRIVDMELSAIAEKVQLHKNQGYPEKDLLIVMHPHLIESIDATCNWEPEVKMLKTYFGQVEIKPDSVIEGWHVTTRRLYAINSQLRDGA